MEQYKDSSKLEQLSEKGLTQFFKQLRKSYGQDLVNSPLPLANDDDFLNDCDSTSTIFGFGKCEFIDIDYIISIIVVNSKTINDGIITHIPKLSRYSFDINVHETVRQTTTYTHKNYSYDSKVVVEIAKKMDFEGDVSHWEGEITSTDIHDSDVISVDWSNLSLHKLS